MKIIEQKQEPIEVYTVNTQTAGEETPWRFVRFEIYGEPTGAKATEINRKTGSVYRPKEHKQRVSDVTDYALKYIELNNLSRPIFPAGEPLGLSVEFIFPWRQSDYYQTKGRKGELKDNVSRWVIGKKDTDNLLKPLKDGLQGIIYANDNQIVHYGEIDKIRDVTPRTVVKVWRLE